MLFPYTPFLVRAAPRSHQETSPAVCYHVLLVQVACQPSGRTRFIKQLWPLSYIPKTDQASRRRGISRWCSSATPFGSHTLQVVLQHRRNIPANCSFFLEDDNFCHPFPASPRMQSTPGGGRYVPSSPLISHTCMLSPASTFASWSKLQQMGTGQPATAHCPALSWIVRPPASEREERMA